MTWWALKSAILPPGSLIALLMCGWLLLRVRPRLAAVVLLVALVSLWSLSTPFVASRLLASLQIDRGVGEPVAHSAGAIVVLAAGTTRRDGERSTARPDALSLERLDQAVRMHRASGLPVLASGGSARGEVPVATLMAETLREVYGVDAVWTETRSIDTWTSAAESARLLRTRGVDHAVVVTHGWHMRRALFAFGATGLRVTPTAAAPIAPVPLTLAALVPTAESLLESHYALYERAGFLWYHWRRSA
jgi:uncharacterized SAM-binding protein YcdF (DUF218 family)